MLGWQKIWIDDVKIVTIWPRYNLQTRYKIRTKLCISSSTCCIDFKYCQMCWGNKKITLKRHRGCHVTFVHFQTRQGMRTRFWISNCTCTIDFKLCWICWGGNKNYITKVIMVVSWLGYNLKTRNKNETRTYLGFCNTITFGKC